MDHHAISQQILNEHQTLAFVVDALRATVGWKYQGADLTRKLTSLVFVTQSFQRHLKHLLELEEADGYMVVVITAHPEWQPQIEALQIEHGQFRQSLRRILAGLRRVAPDDHATFAKLSSELLALLDKLSEHNNNETHLLQKALLRDQGGEG